MQHNFCTVFSKASLYRGLLLHKSLQTYDSDFRLFIVCLEEETHELVQSMNLRNVILIPLIKIEEVDYELVSIKNTRDNKEYSWTLKAPLMLYLFKHIYELNNIVYIDGDIEFYANPDPIYEELKDNSIMLTRERFYIQNNSSWYKQYGNFNGGIIAVNKDDNALNALRWLRKKCIDWCYNKLENGLYGDQIYLVNMVNEFDNIHIARNMGLNVTAWYSHASVVEKSDETFYINDVPIVFYHYSGLIYYNKNEYDLCVYIGLPEDLIELIYIPYLNRLQESIRSVEHYDSSFYTNSVVDINESFVKNYFSIEDSDVLLDKYKLKLVFKYPDTKINEVKVESNDYISKVIALKKDDVIEVRRLYDGQEAKNHEDNYHENKKDKKKKDKKKAKEAEKKIKEEQKKNKKNKDKSSENKGQVKNSDIHTIIVTNSLSNIEEKPFQKTSQTMAISTNAEECRNSPSINLCTLFSTDYLISGLAMYNSIKENSSNYHIWICCLDDTTYEVLTQLNLVNTTLFHLNEIEDKELQAVKENREMNEYCWTLKSSLVLYLLLNFNLPSVIYLDSDLYFFGNPNVIVDEFNDYSVFICKQRDSIAVENVFGKFQAGLLGFKNDVNSIACLKWWKERCIEWCSSEQGLPDKWGDQKYLDHWPYLFRRVKISENWGINAALWSAKNNTTYKDMKVLIKDNELVAFHFCCFVYFNEQEFDLWKWPNWHVDDTLIACIYKPYIEALKQAMRQLGDTGLNVSDLFNPSLDKANAVNYFRYIS